MSLYFVVHHIFAVNLFRNIVKKKKFMFKMMSFMDELIATL